VPTYIQDHHNFVSAIAMAVNSNVAAQHFGQNLEAIIVSRRRTPESSLLFLFVVFIPLLPILPGLHESTSYDKLHTHPRPWNNIVTGTVDAGRVFAQRKLDSPGRTLQHQL